MTPQLPAAIICGTDVSHVRKPYLSRNIYLRPVPTQDPPLNCEDTWADLSAPSASASVSIVLHIQVHLGTRRCLSYEVGSTAVGQVRLRSGPGPVAGVPHTGVSHEMSGGHVTTSSHNDRPHGSLLCHRSRTCTQIYLRSLLISWD